MNEIFVKDELIDQLIEVASKDSSILDQLTVGELEMINEYLEKYKKHLLTGEE